MKHNSLDQAAREQWASNIKPKNNGEHTSKQLRLIGDILAGRLDDSPAFRKAFAEVSLAQEQDAAPRQSGDDLATDLCLTALEKITYLRSQMAEALKALEDHRSVSARLIISGALKATDTGQMKVWQPGEEPF